MQKIETVLDLLTFIDQQIKKGVIDYDSPVKVVAGNGKINNADVGIVNQSAKKRNETVSRAGIKCLGISLRFF